MKLWEMRYGEEPVNGRLFLLRFMRKIHIVIMAALIGAVLVGVNFAKACASADIFNSLVPIPVITYT